MHAVVMMALDNKDAATDLARSRAELSRPHLLVMWDGGSISRPVSDGESITIGRAADCGLVIDHPSVSRRHAFLTIGPRVRIEDLGSSNGTRIGDLVLRTAESAVLESGQAAAIGEVLLVIHGISEHSSRARTFPAPPLVPSVSPARGPREGAAVVNDPVTRRIHEVVELVARSSLPVFLLGETGVGKDVVAETIHRRSPRALRPFVRVNCAAMPNALLESELFGYERGAFTGAMQARVGLVESADGGTVFLDEICEMELTMQAKLLHVLERGEVMRVGSLRPRPVDVRFVAATNRDIDKLMSEGAFRRDLFFRLKGMSIVIPPLAARPGEIAPLAAHFLERACSRLERPLLAIAPAALEYLQRYAWPGNIRELRNVIERAAALCIGDTIEVEHLPLECTLEASPSHSAPAPTTPYGLDEEAAPPANDMRGEVRQATQTLERKRIINALERCAGNQSAAARLLGISRRTLVARLVAYRIPRPIKGRDA
jgi:two-component system, NtrC family, response regulator AtoC